MPAEAKALSEDINRALLDDDRIKADQLTRALHDRAVLAHSGSRQRGDWRRQGRRRLAVQVGTPRALDDLATLTRVLANRDPLADLARRLPSHLRSFERDESIRQGAVEVVTTQKTHAGATVVKTDVSLYGSRSHYGSAGVAWQLVRIATRAAESDDAARIAESPYATAVTIVHRRGRVRGERPARGTQSAPAGDVAAQDHPRRGARRAYRNGPLRRLALEPSARRHPHRSLERAPRGIESTPGHVRRLLRPRPVKEIAGRFGRSTHRRERRGDAGRIRGRLPQLRQRACGQRSDPAQLIRNCKHYLETGTKVLLDALRHAGDADRPFRQSQIDAAIRFCRTCLALTMPGLLAKAAEIAVQAATAERKAGVRALIRGRRQCAIAAPVLPLPPQ